MVAVPVPAIISFYVSPCSSPSQAEMCGAVANPAFILTNNSANCQEREILIMVSLEMKIIFDNF